MFAFLATLWAMLAKAVHVVEINLDSLEEISMVGNETAKSWAATARIDRTISTSLKTAEQNRRLAEHGITL